tara:strand:- start:147 stop:1889 length:1743 start_codon:yes stop_codon:yes gene_type:complete
MNFNLISPKSSPDDFVINFKDPIKIRPNSKVSLNFLELKRKGVVILDKDNTIQFISSKVLPTHLPSAPATANDLNFTAQIPLGVYTFEELQTEIETAINFAIPDKFKQDEGGNSPDRYTSGFDDPLFGDPSLMNDSVIGLRTGVTDFSGFVHDGTDKKDAATTTSGGETVAYTTTNNNGVYDNYAMADTNFDHYRADNSSGQANAAAISFENDSIALVESINTIQNQVGHIGFALAGFSYTEGIAPAPTRINGNTIVTDAAGIPKTFLFFEFQNATDSFIIYNATRQSDGNEISTWTDQNVEIGAMKVIHRVPMSTTFDTSDKIKIGFKMFLEKSTEDSPEYRYQVYNLQGGGGSGVLLYDSHLNRRNLPFKLSIGDSTTYDNDKALESQIPFTFMAFAQNADQGWAKFDYAKLDQSATTDLSLIREYTMTISDELATALNAPNDGVITPLYPNGDNNTAIMLRTDMDINWKSRNYSVFINLPCNNYKNKEDSRDGGFKKSILANVPAPFTTGAVIANQGGDTGQVVSIYQPYTPIVSELKNNEINTNVIGIKIVDMVDEKPATHLTRSIINFTIHDGEN